MASLADRARTQAWRLRGKEPPSVLFCEPRTAFRERVFRRVFGDPACAWPFPRMIGEPDPNGIEGPVVLVSFHLGTVEALGALFERLPGPRLALWACWGVPRPGVRMVDINESGFAFAAKCALDTLRAGGVVFSVADGAGRSRVETDLFGQRIALPRGTFAIARMAGAPLLPVAARWRGRRIEVASGDLIPPGDDSQMAAALMGWLEPYVIQHPEEPRGELRRLLSARRSAENPLAEDALQVPVLDLPGLR